MPSKKLDGDRVVPPHDVNAEKAVLGSLSLLEDYDFVLPTMVLLTPEHFYVSRHRLVFRAMEAMTESHLPIDAVTLSHVLRSKGWYEDVGFVEMVQILESVPHAYHLRYYADIVVDMWRRRRMLDAARWLARQAVDMTADAGETWNRLGQAAERHQGENE